jgi:hypothetical protein
MKISFAIAVVLVLIALFQPWSYDHRGFADATVAVPGGEIHLSLDDHPSGRSYCLSSNFKTKDRPGEPVVLAIQQIGTQPSLELRGRLEKSGTTVGLDGVENRPSFFEGPTIGKVVFPTDQPLKVRGSIQYKGSEHRFQAEMKLHHWEKSRKVIRFCA